MSQNKFPGSNLIGLASSLAFFLSKDLSADDIGLWSSFFSALADNMAIISAAKSMEEEEIESNKDTQ